MMATAAATRSVRLPVVPGEDRWLYAVAGLLLASGVFHLAVQLVLGGPWTGPVSWRKPVTFGFAFGITLATVAWVSTYLRIGGRRRRVLLALFAAACLVEVAVITVQAWRGVPSHFNVSTPVNAAFAYTAAGGGAVILAISSTLFAVSLRPSPAVSRSMALAVRVGLGTFMVALLIGAVMIAMGVVATRTESQVAAYTAATALKPAHAAFMHGILVLPAIAWLADHTVWSEHRRRQVTVAACSSFVLAATAGAAATLLPWGTVPAILAASVALLALGSLVVVLGMVSLAAARRW